MTSDHHTEYLAKAVSALTPEGRKRADELLDELAASVGDNGWIAKFAWVREAEVDLGRTGLTPPDADPGLRLTKQQLDELISGFTTIRDLGTEGAGYADVGLKAAVEQGIILGPRMVVVTRAIVATGSYGPKGAPEIKLPQGAEEADGIDGLAHAVGDQVGQRAHHWSLPRGLLLFERAII